MSSIRFLQLNIEGNKHVERISKFLQMHEFDVIMLEEAPSDVVEQIARTFGYPYTVFTFFSHYDFIGQDAGVSILSKYPFVESGSVPIIDSDEAYEMMTKHKPGYKFALTYALVDVPDMGHVRICATHLPVYYPGHETSEFQIKASHKLHEILESYNQFLLCGDFNAPRGYQVFDSFAVKYKDNIPKEILSTIDPTLHRVPDLQYVIDVAFITPRYHVRDVIIHEGLSDHKGVSGVLEIV